MRLAFKFKNGDNMLLSEAETRSVFKQMNYVKLLMSLSNSAGFLNKSFKVLDRDIKPCELKSVEVLI